MRDVPTILSCLKQGCSLLLDGCEVVNTLGNSGFVESRVFIFSGVIHSYESDCFYTKGENSSAKIIRTKKSAN